MLSPFKENIGNINSWLLAVLFFLIPTQIAPAYIVSAIMLLLWIIEGKFKEKFRRLKVEPLVWIFIAYYGAFLLSLLWTTDLEWGWRMVNRQNFFLLFGLYFAVARPEHFWRYVAAFLLSIAMCEMFAYYNWTRLYVLPGLPEGVSANKGAQDTAPFVDRIMYTPALALGGYLAGYCALFIKQGIYARMGYGVLFLTTVGNLLFSGGRAGIVGFFSLLALLVFQRFSKKPFMAAFIAGMLITGIFVIGYTSNDYFQSRADEAFEEIINYEENINSSVGLRINLAVNSWRIFINNPVLGVGAGDYPEEYVKINETYSPDWVTAWNPHNQYLLALTSAGILGGVMLTLVLSYPLFRRRMEDERQRIRVAIPVLLIVICCFESYLMRSNISFMYVLFTAALWCGESRSLKI